MPPGTTEPQKVCRSNFGTVLLPHSIYKTILQDLLRTPVNSFDKLIRTLAGVTGTTGIVNGLQKREQLETPNTISAQFQGNGKSIKPSRRDPSWGIKKEIPLTINY